MAILTTILTILMTILTIIIIILIIILTIWTPTVTIQDHAMLSGIKIKYDKLLGVCCLSVCKFVCLWFFRFLSHPLNAKICPKCYKINKQATNPSTWSNSCHSLFSIKMRYSTPFPGSLALIEYQHISYIPSC